MKNCSHISWVLIRHIQKTPNKLEILKSNGWRTLVKRYQMEVSVTTEILDRWLACTEYAHNLYFMQHLQGRTRKWYGDWCLAFSLDWFVCFGSVNLCSLGDIKWVRLNARLWAIRVWFLNLRFLSVRHYCRDFDKFVVWSFTCILLNHLYTLFVFLFCFLYVYWMLWKLSIFMYIIVMFVGAFAQWLDYYYPSVNTEMLCRNFNTSCSSRLLSRARYNGVCLYNCSNRTRDWRAKSLRWPSMYGETARYWMENRTAMSRVQGKTTTTSIDLLTLYISMVTM